MIRLLKLTQKMRRYGVVRAGFLLTLDGMKKLQPAMINLRTYSDACDCISLNQKRLHSRIFVSLNNLTLSSVFILFNFAPHLGNILLSHASVIFFKTIFASSIPLK